MQSSLCDTARRFLGGPAFVLCLMVSGCTDLQLQYGSAYEGLFGELPEPSELVAVEMVFDQDNPDRQRVGLGWMAASGYGSAEAYRAGYRLLVKSTDPGVRAAAANTLGHHGTVDDTALLLGLLIDDDAFVRWQAANALRKIHDPAAAPALVERLDPDLEDDQDTRAACALALGQYRNRVVFSALVTALSQQGTYQVAAAAHASLVQMTGHDAGQDPRKWIDWAARNPEPFANGRPYTYDVYDPTLTYWDRYVTFWNNPDTTPRLPRGLE